MGYNPQDSYYKKAKQEGYRSRAAYKLLELQQRFPSSCDLVMWSSTWGLLRGWLRLPRSSWPERKSNRHRSQQIEILHQPNIIFLRGDIASPEISKKISELVDGKANCVLSDLAPHLSGIRDADVALDHRPPRA